MGVSVPVSRPPLTTRGKDIEERARKEREKKEQRDRTKKPSLLGRILGGNLLHYPTWPIRALAERYHTQVDEYFPTFKKGAKYLYNHAFPVVLAGALTTGIAFSYIKLPKELTRRAIEANKGFLANYESQGKPNLETITQSPENPESQTNPSNSGIPENPESQTNPSNSGIPETPEASGKDNSSSLRPRYSPETEATLKIAKLLNDWGISEEEVRGLTFVVCDRNPLDIDFKKEDGFAHYYFPSNMLLVPTFLIFSDISNDTFYHEIGHNVFRRVLSPEVKKKFSRGLKDFNIFNDSLNTRISKLSAENYDTIAFNHLTSYFPKQKANGVLDEDNFDAEGVFAQYYALHCLRNIKRGVADEKTPYNLAQRILSVTFGDILKNIGNGKQVRPTDLNVVIPSPNSQYETEQVYRGHVRGTGMYLGARVIPGIAGVGVAAYIAKRRRNRDRESKTHS